MHWVFGDVGMCVCYIQSATFFLFFLKEERVVRVLEDRAEADSGIRTEG
jgi:hypothetical protein